MNNSSSLSNYQSKIEISLFLSRITVFIVMFAWTVDKFTDPAHGVAILAGFYGLADIGESVVMVIGAIEMLIILAFVAGMWKKYTYGIVLLLHALTTFSSFEQYIGMRLTFFTAWPMLAVCIALFWLRDLDTKFAFGK